MKTASDSRQIHTLSPIHLPFKKNVIASAKKAKIHPQLKPNPIKTLAQQLAQISRRQWVSEAAYFKAEARSFAPGHEIDDWLEAEQEYREVVVQLFLSEFQEDGFTINGLQQLAKAIGAYNIEAIDSKYELIRLIQSTCRHEPCFRVKPGEICPQKEDCQWRADCQKLMAEWWC